MGAYQAFLILRNHRHAAIRTVPARINSPIIIGAVFASIYFGIFGFHWAPNSALYRKLMFSSLSQNKNNHASQSSIYKNDAESRIWYLGNPPGIDSPGDPFRQVRVEQFSAPER